MHNLPLEKTVLDFLLSRYDPKRPLLLAFSGGPDSLALLHLLIQIREKHPLKLAIAHVDHGWRTESANEAQQIATMAQKLNVDFHLKTLNPVLLEGNLEAACRQERLNFFKTLFIEKGYQAIVLAHHADDLAETVLKRTLEGSCLSSLSGLRLETTIKEMLLWRPLLTIPKIKILEWLKKNQLKGFHDKTNEDPKFLRARFRLQILPELAKVFGKEVSSNLCHLGIEAGELREYLDQKIAPFIQNTVHYHWGTYLNLRKNCPETNFEIKHLVRKYCELEGFFLSRSCLNQVLEFLQKKVANKMVETGTHRLYIDRGDLFAMSEHFAKLPHESKVLREGTNLFGSWTIQMAFNNKGNNLGGWQSILEPKIEVNLPEGVYEVSAPQEGMLYRDKGSLSKWWGDNKAPAFIRQHIPVITQNNQVCHQFVI